MCFGWNSTRPGSLWESFLLWNWCQVFYSFTTPPTCNFFQKNWEKILWPRNSTITIDLIKTRFFGGNLGVKDFWYPISTPPWFLEAIFFGRDKNFAHIRILFSPWTTLSPIIMEVENHPKWKETNHWRDPFSTEPWWENWWLEDDSVPFGEPKGLFSGGDRTYC